MIAGSFRKLFMKTNLALSSFGVVDYLNFRPETQARFQDLLGLFRLQ